VRVRARVHCECIVYVYLYMHTHTLSLSYHQQTAMIVELILSSSLLLDWIPFAVVQHVRFADINARAPLRFLDGNGLCLALFRAYLLHVVCNVVRR